MKKFLSSLVILALAAVPARANLLTDGGFELELLTGPDVWLDYFNGDTMGAWDVTANDVMLFGVGDGDGVWSGPALEGNEIANLGSSYGPGRIEQDFATEVGKEYVLSFWAKEYEGTNTPTGVVYVRVYNGGGDDLNVTTTYTLTWTKYTYTFTASDTTSILEFTNGSYDGPDEPDSVSLDDVRVVPFCTNIGTVVELDDPMQVTESDPNGTTVQFSVVLDNAPGAAETVTVDIDSSGNGVDLTIDPTQLAFTIADWDTPQTVTVKALDDTEHEGQEVDEIGFTVGTDPNICIDHVVEVTIVDNEVPAILVSPTGVTVQEGGASDTYQVVPSNAVSGNTTINIGSPNPADPNVPEPLAQVTVNGGATAQLTFTTGDWETPQTVTVAAVEDIVSVPDGDPQNVTIGHTVNSADPVYHHIGTTPNVAVTINDNDCGSWGYHPMDFNTDCYITVIDFALFAATFLDCSEPYAAGCVQP